MEIEIIENELINLKFALKSANKLISKGWNKEEAFKAYGISLETLKK